MVDFATRIRSNSFWAGSNGQRVPGGTDSDSDLLLFPILFLILSLVPYQLMAAFGRPLVFILIWLLIQVVDRADWNAGIYRGIALLGLALIIPLLIRLTPKRVPKINGLLFLGVLIIFAFHLVVFERAMRNPSINDIGFRTLQAGELLLEGQNPYSVPLDPSSISDVKTDGFKYLPLMAVAYAPLGYFLGERGIILTNLFIEIATLIAIFLTARGLGDETSGLVATLCFLLIEFVPRELFQVGVNDLCAVLPLVYALYFCQKGKAFPSGLLVGTSVATKLLPGALFVIPFASCKQKVKFFWGFLVGIVPTMLFFFLSPRNFLNNVLLFNFYRPADSTSFLFRFPIWLREFATLGFAVAFIAVNYFLLRKNRSGPERIGFALVLIFGVLLIGSVDHRNYQFWWLPFYSILLGRLFYSMSSAPA